MKSAFYILTSVLSLFSFHAYRMQSDLEEVIVHQEQQPEFPGGMKALAAYLRQTVHYPEAAAKAGVKGRVIASFVIDTVGCISQISILRGIGYGCDEEIIRAVEQMPRWKPGRLYDRVVAVKYMLPVVLPLSQSPEH